MNQSENKQRQEKYVRSEFEYASRVNKTNWPKAFFKEVSFPVCLQSAPYRKNKETVIFSFLQRLAWLGDCVLELWSHLLAPHSLKMTNLCKNRFRSHIHFHSRLSLVSLHSSSSSNFNSNSFLAQVPFQPFASRRRLSLGWLGRSLFLTLSAGHTFQKCRRFPTSDPPTKKFDFYL